MDANDLLAGPRGRRLCWNLLLESMPDEPRSRVWHAGFVNGDLTRVLDDLRAGEPDADEAHLLTAFADSVGYAAYWQAPDEADQALAVPDVRDALGPAAATIITATAAQWWRAPMAREDQVCVQWSGQGDPAPGAAGKLASWREETLRDEDRAGRERPDDPAAPYSGYWWSTPALSGLINTSRSIPSAGPTRLVLVEDSMGWTEAACWQVEPHPGARVYEVSDSRHWIDLVRRYPLDVSRSRRHDWWRVTGRAERWLIPDYAAVSADYDAIHVTAGGYLSTAGRALPVGDGHTMLAGWDPDVTYWLTDVLTVADSPARWISDPGGAAAWRPA